MKQLRVALSVLISALFLYLAFRGVDFHKVGQSLRHERLGHRLVPDDVPVRVSFGDHVGVALGYEHTAVGQYLGVQGKLQARNAETRNAIAKAASMRRSERQLLLPRFSLG